MSLPSPCNLHKPQCVLYITISNCAVEQLVCRKQNLSVAGYPFDREQHGQFCCPLFYFGQTEHINLHSSLIRHYRRAKHNPLTFGMRQLFQPHLELVNSDPVFPADAGSRTFGHQIHLSTFRTISIPHKRHLSLSGF